MKIIALGANATHINPARFLVIYFRRFQLNITFLLNNTPKEIFLFQSVVIELVRKK